MPWWKKACNLYQRCQNLSSPVHQMRSRSGTARLTNQPPCSGCSPQGMPYTACTLDQPCVLLAPHVVASALHTVCSVCWPRPCTWHLMHRASLWYTGLYWTSPTHRICHVRPVYGPYPDCPQTQHTWLVWLGCPRLVLCCVQPVLDGFCAHAASWQAGLWARLYTSLSQTLFLIPLFSIHHPIHLYETNLHIWFDFAANILRLIKTR